MSLADGVGKAAPVQSSEGQTYLLDALSARTMSGHEVWDRSYRQVQRIDPGGSARNVTLPAEEDGLWFFIVNNSDQSSGEDLTVKIDAGGTLATVANDQACLVMCDGTTWYKVALFTVVAP